MHVKFWAQTESTRFLALDKYLRPADFIEIIEITGNGGIIGPDPEWSSIANLPESVQFQQLYPDT